MMRVAFALLFAAFNLSAAISVEGFVEDRYALADAVCRGRAVSAPAPSGVGSTDSAGKLMPLDYSVDVSIDGCYKGQNLPPVATVWFLHRDQTQGPLPASGEHVLMFLALRDGRYIPVTKLDSFVSFWDLPAAAGAAPAGLEQLEADIAGAVGGSDAQRSRDALTLLLGFRHLSPQTSEKLQAIAQTNGNVSVSLLAARLTSTTGAERRTALRQLNGALQTQTSVSPIGLDSALAAIQSETSIDDLEALEETVATSASPAFRLNAMLAVRRLSSRKSVPFLVGQLNSSDPLVAYEAVITLAEITGKGGDYGPGKDLFDQNPSRYKQLWMAWWSQEGAQFR